MLCISSNSGTFLTVTIWIKRLKEQFKFKNPFSFYSPAQSGTSFVLYQIVYRLIKLDVQYLQGLRCFSGNMWSPSYWKSVSPRFPSFTHNVLHPLNLLGVPSGLTPECKVLSCAGEAKTEHNTADTSQVPKRGEKSLPELMIAPLLLQLHKQLDFPATKPLISDSTSAYYSLNPHIFYCKNPCIDCCSYVMVSKMYLRRFF